MTNEQFTELMNELRTLRAVIVGKNSLEASAPKAPSAKATGDVPLPTSAIEDAESVEVHFGKNKGVRLGSLQPKSVEWYAQDAEPRLKKDGTPFAPRPEDVRLREAARTLVHQRRGTIPMPANKPVLQNETISEDVPF